MSEPELPEVQGLITTIAGRFDKARQNPALSIPLFLKDNTGAFIRNSAIHLYIWEWFLRKRQEGHRFFLLEMPRGHAKTNQVSVGYIAHAIGMNPQIRAKIFCNNDDNSWKRVGDVRKIIESPDYKLIYPWVKPGSPWRDTAFRVDCSRGDPANTLEGFGVNAASTGERMDLGSDADGNPAVKSMTGLWLPCKGSCCGEDSATCSKLTTTAERLGGVADLAEQLFGD